MADHGSRDHAQWSASSTERNWNCAGALALTDGLPETTNEAADWGTCCHQISEKCLHDGGDADRFIGTTEKGKKHSFEVDEEMAETAQVYVDYVRSKNVAGATLFIEQKFSLASLKPPFDAGGTADAVVHTPSTRHLDVIDLKGGRGHVVEVEGNPQLRTYALGAMLANTGLAVDTITVTIVQPRAPHKSGRTRSETFHVADLLEWTVDLVAAMKRSASALQERGQADNYIGDAILTPAAWAAKWLSAGDHCKFCKAAGFCPALEQKTMDAAGVWFDDLDQPRISNTPDMLSPERAAQLLDAADMISDYVNAVRAYWHAQAEMGVEIPNYILVAKTGREKWNDGVEATVTAAAAKAGLSTDKYLNAPKLKTPKQVREALKKAKQTGVAADLEKLSAAPENGTNLVRADKTTREAATPSVHKHFSILD